MIDSKSFLFFKDQTSKDIDNKSKISAELCRNMKALVRIKFQSKKDFEFPHFFTLLFFFFFFFCFFFCKIKEVIGSVVL